VSSNNSRDRILDVALALITKRKGADVSMAKIAKAARVSRQAMYLHFADRADLMLAVVRHADEKRGLENEIRKIAAARTGVAAMGEMVSLQARMNPGIWAIARALDAVRRADEAAEQGWQDRLKHRLSGCRQIVARLHQERTLKPGISQEEATDLLWSMTSLRTWEDLVLERGWRAAQYEERVTRLLCDSLTNKNVSSSQRYKSFNGRED
jgi:AcrR family transcriptional regulator